MAWPKKEGSGAEVKSIENSLKMVVERRDNMIYKLGELYYHQFKDAEIEDEEFKNKVDTINKLDYNCKVWENRKLKTQGLRKCDSCGNILPYESFFCNKCGVKLDIVAEELVIIQD